ncbi:tandem-95 repeat protein [Pelagicoccus sp. NFK12]|uniref:Tandem-95 repeat protein n=1 Tax=Pelagicoccus enzymogenes TaxID=2773457 RepID=A0A927IFN5_9BACT|nr:Ig-like domain-containing protein [Pelagicoccus enzymogenes]MBD5778291.1 tandem-95 repeat protein [Pelagicoccus enzymogenes]
MKKRNTVLRYVLQLLVAFLLSVHLTAETGDRLATASIIIEHPPTINGLVDGDIRFNKEGVLNLNSGAEISGILKVPGTPTVKINANGFVGEILEGEGSVYPSNYRVHVNGSAIVSTVLTKSDPEPLSHPKSAIAPSGYRKVTINSPFDDPGDFATIRDFSVNSEGLSFHVSPGAYGRFSLSNGSELVLGSSGSNEPVVYSFERIQLNGNSKITLLSEVVIDLSNGFSTSGTIGSEEHPEWLSLNVSKGGVNLNDHGRIYGRLKAPVGHVNINSHARLEGALEANRLNLNAKGEIVARLAVNPTENTPPVASGKTVDTLEDVPIALALIASDADGDELGYTVLASPENGVLSGELPNLIYTPDLNFFGTDSFTFSANDGFEESNVAMVTIEIESVNDVPVAAALSHSTLEDAPVEMQLKGEDADSTNLVFNITEEPRFGSLDLSELPRVRYIPNQDSDVDDTFTYTVFDGEATSDPAIVAISVTPVNDAPDALPLRFELLEDSVLDLTLVGADAEGAQLEFEIVNQPAYGSIELLQSQDPIVDPDYKYVPNPEWFGSDRFTYRVFDGVDYSGEVSVLIGVQPVNDRPVAVGDLASVNEDNVLIGELDGDDVDGDNLSFALETTPTSGSILVTREGDFEYLPETDYFGNDSFTFSVSDGVLQSDPQTFNIVVLPVNDTPVAISDSVNVTEDVPLQITLVGTDVEEGQLSYAITNPPAHGSLSGTAPDLLYTPNLNYSSPEGDGFSFIVNDGELDSQIANVEIAFAPVNDIPSAEPVEFITVEDTLLSELLTGSDIEGDVLTFNLAQPAENGVVSIGTSGSFTYLPDPDFYGSDSFTFTVSDNVSISTPSIVSLTVSPIDDAPVAKSLSLEIIEDTQYNGFLQGEDSDNDLLEYGMASPPVYGVVRIQSDGSFMYVPNENFYGQDLFSFFVSDGNSNSDPAGVIISVVGVNDGPAVVSTNFSVPENQSLPIILEGFDVEGDSITFSIISSPLNGILLVDGVELTDFPARVPWEKLVYVPTAGYGSTESLQIAANDGLEDSVVATISISIEEAVNQAPIVDAGSDETYFVSASLSQTGGAGALVVCSDEWALSDHAYSVAPTTSAFALNVIRLFADEPGSTFLARSEAGYRGFAQSEFIGDVEDEGHAMVVDPYGPLSLEYLSSFSAVFVDATYPVDRDLLGQYLESGGNVYITMASAFVDPLDEAEFWNPFLAEYGMSIASSWNGLNANIPMETGNALSEEVERLYYWNGASITLQDPDDPALTVVQKSGGELLMVARFKGFEASTMLDGSVSDDGLPLGSEVVSDWKLIEGSDDISFGDFSEPQSRVSFYAPGSYSLRLEATDGELVASDEVEFLVVQNQAPIVSAGSNVYASGPTAAIDLNGFVSDDALPSDTLLTEWTASYGPSSLLFSDATDPETSVSVVDPGVYVLSLEGSDTLDRKSDTTELRVGPLESAPVAASIAAWWPFNASPKDMITGGNSFRSTEDLVFENAKVSAGLLLEGRSSPICVSAGSSLDVGKSEYGFTVEAWVKPSEFRDAAIVEWSSSEESGVGFRQWYFGRGLYGFIRDTDGNEHTVFVRDVLEVDVWQHIALSYDRKTGTARIYIDGRLVKKTNLGVFTPKTNLDLCLGGSKHSGLLYQGAIDELALYREPLEDGEVSAIYAAGLAGKLPVEYSYPTVDAGVDLVLKDSEAPAQLNAVIKDDSSEVVVGWSLYDGPGSVAFTDSGSLSTEAHFDTAGIYLLEVSVYDGIVRSFDRVEVRVGTRSVDPANSLAAWWPLNGTPEEVLNGKHDFELDVGTEFGTGFSSLGVDFDGNPGVLEAHAATGLDIGPSPQGWTVELWMNPSEFRDTPLVEWADDSSYGVSLRQWWFGRGLYGFIRDASGVVHEVFAQDVLELNSWQHVALSYSPSTGVASLYRNGEEVAVKKIGLVDTQTSFDFVAGGSPREDRYFIGKLDEISLYNESLSRAQISAIYGAGASGKTPLNNKAPVVRAGDDLTLLDLDSPVYLSATVDDDGLPNNSLSIQWSTFSGPSSVSFSEENAAATLVQFDAEGVYILEIAVSDGISRSTDTLTVRVGPAAAETLSGIAAWWPLDDDPSEAVSGVHNLTIHQGVNFATGIVGEGLNFDGVSSRASALGGTGIDVGASEDGLTLELWVNPSEYRDTPLVEWAEGSLSGVSLRQWWYGQGVFGFLRDTSGNEHTLSAYNVMQLDKWQHVALTYDAVSGMGRLYLDGAEIASENLGLFTPQTSLDFVAGASLAEGRFFKGKLDEITLHKRPLSPVEIESIYQVGSSGYASYPSLNLPPSISAGPDLTIGSISGPIELTGIAVDDDKPTGQPLQISWTQKSGPAASISSPHSLITPVVLPEVGDYEFVLSVDDSEYMVSDSIRVRVGVFENNPPIVSAGMDRTVQVGEILTLEGSALDDDLPLGHSLSTSWTVVSSAGRLTFDDQYDPQSGVVFGSAGVYQLRLDAYDGEYLASDLITVTAYDDVDVSLTLPATGDVFTLEQSIILQADAFAGQTPARSVEFFVNGESVGSVPPLPGSLTHRLSLPAALVDVVNGRIAVYAVANDGRGQAATSKIHEISVVDPQVAAPVAILSQDQASIVTAPTDLMGTASSEIIDRYEVLIRKAGEVTWRTLASSESPVVEGLLAALDTTVLLNGLYELRLETTDLLGRTASDEAVIVVDGGMKVGNLSLAFEDLSVPVSGFPMQVVRSYDSRDASKGDFGNGWQMALSNMLIQKNRPIGTNWMATQEAVSVPFFGDTIRYRVESSRDNLVLIRLPDDSVAVFKAVASPAYKDHTPLRDPKIAFEPLGDTLGSLEIVGDDEVWISSFSGETDLESEAFAFDVFDPKRFKYTTEEGQEFVIDEDLGLLSMTDRNGNTLTISDDGVAHSSGLGIAFTRDAEGRITAITDPENQTLSYAYDAEGRLETFTNRSDETFTYLYENPHFPNYLTDIVGPDGKSVLASEFDANGRLASQTDANGESFDFIHDIENFKETVVNRLGVTTVHTYDIEGDVTLTEVFDTEGILVQSTAYEYDARGNETKVTDSLGNVTERSYDGSDNLLSETQTVSVDGIPTASTTSYTYDSANNPLTITDALSNTTTFAYDASGNLLSQTDALENVTQFTYDASGNLESITDPLGNQTVFTISLEGYQTSSAVYDADGVLVQYQSFEYDSLGQQIRSKDYDLPEGASETTQAVLYRYTDYDYDGEGRQTSTVVYDANDILLTSSSTDYDSRGQVSRQTDALGRYSEFVYDDYGNRTQSARYDENDALLASESWTYDAEGRQSSYSDVLGRLMKYDYDAHGRQTTVRFIGLVDENGEDLDPSDNTETHTIYDSIGRVEATVDERGKVTLYEYDENCGCSGHRAKVIDPLLNETVSSYDLNGNQTSVLDANGHLTLFEYDALNRPTRTTFHDGTYNETVYDALGRRIAIIDQNGLRTDYVYDALGRLVEVRQPAPAAGDPRPVTYYGYDSRGNQTSQIDAEGRETKYEYDELGRRVKRILPELQEESYQYDALGNLIAKTDFNGYTTVFEYDRQNRLVKETADPTHPSLTHYNAPSWIERSYDVAGNLLTSAVVNGQSHGEQTLYNETRTYDERNRLATRSTPEGTLSYAYDVAGNLESTTSSNADGIQNRYTYDALNRLESVNDDRLAASLSLTSYTYDDVGNLDTIVYGNGIRHDYAYDTLNRLTNLSILRSDTSLAQSYAYTLGNAGNRETIAEARGRVTHYEYDSLYRLSKETILGTSSGASGIVAYGYDAVGNRTSRVSSLHGVNGQNFTYDDNDRLDGNVYDANGNTLSSVDGREGISDTVTDVYDFRNRLIRRIREDGQVINLSYDADGNRVGKQLLDISQSVLRNTSYLVDLNNHTGYAQVVEERLNEGAGYSLAARYTYGHDLISQTRDEGTSWYLYDGHGSVRALVDETETVTDEYEYDAFGILLSSSAATKNVYLYTGEQYDADLGMYFLRARYLNAGTGRFHNMDTYEGRNGEPLTLHKYLYAHNNPVMMVDPSGNVAMVTLAQGNFARLMLHSMAAFRTAFLVNVGIQARTVSVAAPLIRELQGLSAELASLNPAGAANINGMIDTLQDMINPQESLFKTLALSSYAGFAASLPPPWNNIGWIPTIINSGKQAALVYYINAAAYASIGFDSDKLSLRSEIDLHSISSILSVVFGFRSPAKDIAPATSLVRDLRSGSFRSAGANLEQLGLNLSHYGHVGAHALSMYEGRSGTASVIGGSGKVVYVGTGVFSR